MISSFLILLAVIFSPGESLRNYVDEYLKEKLSYYDKYEFSIVAVPEVEGEFEIVENRNISLNTSIVYLPVKISNSGNSVQSYLTIRLKLYKNVFVTVNKIESKQSVEENLLEKKIIDVALLRGTPVESINEVKNLRSKIMIKPGSVLIKEFLENIPVVKAGDFINASVVEGNVKITINAEARQEGSEGDIIRVVTKDKKQFKAKIINSENVKIVD